jgi:hypothetical protein
MSGKTEEIAQSLDKIEALLQHSAALLIEWGTAKNDEHLQRVATVINSAAGLVRLCTKQLRERR